MSLFSKDDIDLFTYLDSDEIRTLMKGLFFLGACPDVMNKLSKYKPISRKDLNRVINVLNSLAGSYIDTSCSTLMDLMYSRSNIIGKLKKI